MRKHKVTLENSFHNTRTAVLVPTDIQGPYEAWWYLYDRARLGGASDRRRWARVWRDLCPHSDCQCGGLRP